MTQVLPPGSRSPLARARHLGAAHGGTQHFKHMRLTALASLPLTLYFISFVASVLPLPYAQVRAALTNSFAAGMLALFVLVNAWHMWLGMQEIIEDYVHGEGLKFALLTANRFFCALVAFAALFALLRLNLGL